MAGNFIFPEWHNANTVRAYPLADAGSRLDVSGLIKLPDSLITDAAFTVHPDYAGSIFYCSKVSLLPQAVEIEISCHPVSGPDYIFGSVSSALEAGASLSIAGTGSRAGMSGVITLGDPVKALQEMMGSFQFEASSAYFDIATMHVSMPAVRFVEFLNNEQSVGVFDRIVKLSAGRNIRLTYVGSDTIRIDAIDGLNLVLPSDCEDAIALGAPIRTINGIAPDEAQNFTIDGSECIDIEEETAGIRLIDTCSKSCCGCDELASLLDAQASLEAQYQSLRERIQTIQATQSELLGNIIANLT